MAKQKFSTTVSTNLNEFVKARFIKDAKGYYRLSRPLKYEEIISSTQLLIAKRLFRKKITLTSSLTAKQYYITKLANLEYEAFFVTFLDVQRRIISVEEMFRGTFNIVTVYPREVVKQALSHNAAAVILTHNHPSGITEPSPSDVAITLRLKEALELVNIEVADHIIVAGAKAYSFVEHKLL